MPAVTGMTGPSALAALLYTSSHTASAYAWMASAHLEQLFNVISQVVIILQISSEEVRLAGLSELQRELRESSQQAQPATQRMCFLTSFGTGVNFAASIHPCNIHKPIALQAGHGRVRS